ncbi:branched-chain amino acid ABC transporter permease [Pollutimonas bauzanensis]|uniref:Amino acid/amide ABC transporter membrane protein 2, HAAT family n=1 Tax=Pollutimonas bauzanensis TaxID=658167 RepID=A0A1M5UQD5_9BURK|nr:branched-chain amino acid ABC transporter permease [Pollutimonas bauzanensis]SHH65292.1 amino acid/amide ABC transporter membrane protein 2, HAAT family [Pollutimonas bauzanensis]
MPTQDSPLASPDHIKEPFRKEIIRVAVILLIALGLPLLFDGSTIDDFSYYLLWTFCGIGLAAMWGHAGILSFGQSAFFGLAGYAYGVLTINFGDSVMVTWAGLLGSMLIAGAFAAFLGYMIFYGGVTGIFIGIITLSITLVFETFMAQTAGPQWVIGDARLNGYNGMSGMPPLAIPWLDGTVLALEGTGFYCLLVILLALVYLATQYMLKSPFGLTLTSIKENPRRAEMLGIDIRKYQLLIFVFGGVLAGLSGSLYTIWGSYITPSSMGLTAAAMPVIWVATAGRKNIGGVVIATVGFVWLSQWLAIYGSEYALILMGAVLLFVVLAAPEGLFPWVIAFAGRHLGKKHRNAEGQ